MKIHTILLIALTLVFTACNNQKTEENHEQPTPKHKNVTIQPNEVSINNEQLNAVYQQYLLLGNALVNSDISTAKEAAMAVELGAKNIKGGANLSKLASKITATKSLETQRILFSDLSNEMIARVKASGLKSGEVYVEYCPMALNDKGASWLSNQKEIRNPYYGEEMLDCGEVKETLK